MKEYILALDIPYLEFDTYKEKSALSLQLLIKGSRISEHISFCGYGTADFVTTNHQEVKVEITDTFKRGKTNCIIYNLIPTKYNPGIFDKVFIYYSVTGNSTFYGYVLYNTKTKKHSHKYCIDYADDVLVRYIMGSLTFLPQMKIYGYYIEQDKRLREFKGQANKLLTISDYDKMKKEYEEWEMKELYDIS